MAAIIERSRLCPRMAATPRNQTDVEDEKSLLNARSKVRRRKVIA
jgi:hypothetical protein